MLTAVSILLLLLALALGWRPFLAFMVPRLLVPRQPFASPEGPGPDYADPACWLARPGLAYNPGLFAPPGEEPAAAPVAAVFFVSPTALYSGRQWNADLGDQSVNRRLYRFAAAQTSVFNAVGDIWSPRYRQATLGAFLRDSPDAAAALLLAGSDVERAFAVFLAAQPPGRPLFVAGHSQGAYHILRLLQRHREALSGRLVAAYAGGWPVMVPADTEATGLPAASGAEDTGCLLSWQTWAANGDLAGGQREMALARDLRGEPVGARPMLCVNPVSGAPTAAPATAHLGVLRHGRLRRRPLATRIHSSGFLLVAPVQWPGNPFLMPRGNFHVIDYGLFWANLRADVARRLAAWERRQQ